MLHFIDDVQEFFDLLSFCFIKPLLYSSEYNSIGDLHLAFGLGVLDGGFSIYDVEVGEVAFELHAYKLNSIVGYEDSRDFGPHDDKSLKNFTQSFSVICYSSFASTHLVM